MRGAAKYYTRIISVFFLLVVLSLIADTLKRGYSYETLHKLLHIGIGVYGVAFLWNTSEKNYRSFSLANGVLFSIAGLVGWMFPDLYGLDAFNRLDTVLHSIVGLSGIAAYFLAVRKL